MKYFLNIIIKPLLLFFKNYLANSQCLTDMIKLILTLGDVSTRFIDLVLNVVTVGNTISQIISLSYLC